MPVSIHIPTPLRPFTEKLDIVQASGATVGEVLRDLTTRYSGLRQHLYAPDGRLRSFVNIYVGRRRHPLPAERADAGRRRSDAEHHPVGRGRRGQASPRRCRR